MHIFAGHTPLKVCASVLLLLLLVIDLMAVVYVAYDFFQYEGIKATCIENLSYKNRFVTAKFETTENPEAIERFMQELSRTSDVEKFTFVSKEQLLVDFKNRHKDDALTLQALEELGVNPLNDQVVVLLKEGVKDTDDVASSVAVVKNVAERNGTHPLLSTPTYTRHIAAVRKQSVISELQGGSYVFGDYRSRKWLETCASDTPTRL